MDPRDLKRCHVCGDKALAFNFDGLSCESCKAFFRRNAHRYDELKCRKNNKCIITIVTRKLCPPCRLKKCFVIGMKKELIVGKRISKKKDLKVNNNNNNNNNTNVSFGELSSVLNNDDVDAESCSAYQQKNKNNDDDAIIKLNNSYQLCSYEIKLLNEIRCAADAYRNINDAPYYQKQKMIIKKCDSSIINFITSNFGVKACDVDQILYTHSPSSPSSPFSSSTITDSPKSSSLCSLSIQSLMMAHNNNNNSNENQKQLVAIYGFQWNYLRSMIRFFKRITPFRDLNIEDQLCLVKGSYTENLFTKSSFHYDPFVDGFILKSPSNENCGLLIRLNLLFHLQMHKKCFSVDNYRRFILALRVEFENDPIIRDTVSMILLFKPNKNNVSNPEFINYHYHVYCYILERYLESKYQDTYKARKKTARIINYIDRICSEELYKSLFHFKIDEFDTKIPIVAEVYRTNENKHKMHFIDFSNQFCHFDERIFPMMQPP